MLCILVEDVLINCVKSVWSWEVSQVLPFQVLPNVAHFWKRNILLLSIPLGRSEVDYENVLCELYVVKIWEGTE